ncbi:MAG: hypothetical protein DHS80DRAFT_25596 [Piptocephalis tieghemiana]|nr:MAG: hypothetical protein DHS80DRAFT_25596 [Piptocephalis tieghemiana]
MQLACILTLFTLLTLQCALAQEQKPKMVLKSLRTQGFLCRSGTAMAMYGQARPECAIYLDDDSTLVYQGTNYRIGFDSNGNQRLIDTSVETTPNTQFARYAGVTPGTESIGYMYVAMPKNADGSPGPIGYANDNGDSTCGINPTVFNYWSLMICPDSQC